jgi:hypothetical protein
LKIEDLRQARPEKLEFGDILKIEGEYCLVIFDVHLGNVRLINLKSGVTRGTYNSLGEVKEYYREDEFIKSDCVKLVIE